MWMKSHFFAPLAVPEGTGRFGSGQEFELSANAKKRDRVFCDLALEHTDQALIFGVAPTSYDSHMPNSLAAFALQVLLHRAGRCGCAKHPAFPAPSVLLRDMTMQTSGEIAPRECGDVTPVIASEAKQSIFAVQRKNGLLRFARNDGLN
jgi:hypothetical protein